MKIELPNRTYIDIRRRKSEYVALLYAEVDGDDYRRWERWGKTPLEAFDKVVEAHARYKAP